MQIDCYGCEATSEFFKRRKLDSHLLKKEDDGTVYECFGRGAMRPIHRISRDGDGTWRVGWAWGAWEDRAELEYVPLDETLEIENEKENKE